MNVIVSRERGTQVREDRRRWVEMLRSLIHSMRGQSAVGGIGVLPGAARAIGYRIQDISAKGAAAESEPVARQVKAIHGKCCVYCGHSLFAGPRVTKVRCPKCFQEVPVCDVVLEGEGVEARYVTGGRIVVGPEGRVAAELVGGVVDIAGWVLGDVLASQVCWVRAGGRVAGRILCRRLELEAGARVEGHVELVRG